ncbi:MAG: heavy-metal-associated domain-containing protein [Saprospiraceae bacterium]
MKETISIQNLKCSGCEASIHKSLKAFPEVESVEVGFTDSTVHIESSISGQRHKYERALTQFGYPPQGAANPLGRKAKSYISCAIGRIAK